MSLQDSLNSYVKGGSIGGFKKPEEEKKDDPFQTYIKSGKVPEKKVVETPAPVKAKEVKYDPEGASVLNLTNDYSAPVSTPAIDKSVFYVPKSNKLIPATLSAPKGAPYKQATTTKEIDDFNKQAPAKALETWASGKTDSDIKNRKAIIQATNTRAVQNIKTGALSMAEGAVGAASWIAPKTMEPYLNKKVENIQDTITVMAVENPNLLDSLTQGAVSAATFFIPGLGISKGASVLYGISPKLALLFGGTMSAALEASVEAGSVYNEVNTELGRDEANKMASATFVSNMALLAITNKFGAFSDSVTGRLKKSLVSSIMEGGQESAQQIIQNLATGKDVTSGVVESGIIGAILGLPMGYIGDMAIDPGVTRRYINQKYGGGAGMEEEKTLLEMQKDFTDGKLQIPKASVSRDELAKLQEKASAGQADPETINNIVSLTDELSDYQQAYKEKAVVINNKDNDTKINIETVKYDDGKFGFTLDAEISGQALSVPFSPIENYSSEKEATKAAQDFIEEWASNNATGITDEIKAEIKKTIKENEISDKQLPTETPGGVKIEYKNKEEKVDSYENNKLNRQLKESVSEVKGMYSVKEKQDLYEKIVKPKVDALGKIEGDEIIVFYQGDGGKDQYVNTNPSEIWHYNVDENLKVEKVKKSELKSTGKKDRDKVGYRKIKKESKKVEPKKTEKPKLKQGDSVKYGDKTGTIRSSSSDDKTIAVDVDQISTAGGVPVGRIEYWPIDKTEIDKASESTYNNKQQYDKQNTRQKDVSDTGEVPAGDNLDKSEIPPSEVSGYDRATVLVESGNGSSGDRTAVLSKKDRQLINEEVEGLLEAKNYSTNPDDYSLEDKDLMSNYSGAGGKESVGAGGAGLLNEYYTPKIVIDKMWEIAKSLNPEIETAFEPSAGTGKIINSAPSNVKIDGAEISKVSGTIASILNPGSEITIGDFQELFFDKTTNKQKTTKQYDLLIGNPPFGERTGFLKGKGEESKIGRQEEYFIKRGLDMTKDGGYLIYVVNSSFLSKGISAGKESISSLGELVSAYRLPENSFEDTSIGTDIVVFKKTGTPKSSIDRLNRNRLISDNEFFRTNNEGVLGETKTRKNRFGKEEKYVVGDLETAIGKIKVEKKETVAPVKKEKKTVEKKAVLPSTKKKPAPRTQKDAQTTLPKKDYEKLVIKKQDVSNNKKTNPQEVDMLRKIDRELSIPNPTEKEKAMLSYEKGKYFPDAIYYSGNIYDKIDYLKNNKKEVVSEVGEDRYNKQLSGLEQAIPKRIPIGKIAFDPMDRHIKKIKTTLDLRVGTQELTIEAAFTRFMHNNDVALSPRVNRYDVIRYVQGDKAAKDTKPIMGLIKSDAKRLFNGFLKNELSPETQKAIEDKYNREKNGYARPDYSKLPISVDNMAKNFRGSEFRLSQTQKEGIGFLVNKGSGVIAYGVGVGKTHTLAIATKANMDKGWTKRPLYVVPKSTIEKTWINTLHEMFPDLVINNLGGLQAPIVKKLKAARGENVKDWIKDGEFTIISHDGLLRLGFKTDELREAAGNLEDALWRPPVSERGKQKTLGQYDEIIGNAQKYVTDIMFSDLGFDHVSVDEVHNFRKIFQGAKPENVDEDGNPTGNKRYANVIGGTPSRRAQQLFLISQNIQKNNNNRNVFLASATPFENHATEVYNILSLVARDRMAQMGLLNINDFFSTFANFEVELDRKLDGEWINREKMKSFSNLPALQSLIKEFIDYQEDKTLVRPERKVLTAQLQMSEKQEDNLQKIQELLTGMKTDVLGVTEKGKVDDGAFLKASTYSIANSVSPYFIDEYTDGEVSAEQIVKDSPKIEYALETVKLLKNDPKTKDYGTFIFFGKQGVKYHPVLAEYFAKYLGYKKEEVAYISGNVSDDAKEDIKEKFNNGKIKVLLGGDQTKEGIDLQNNGFATINLALGWNPTQIQQVEGRVWRQGNMRSVAPLIYPLVENSGDAMIYNKFEEKGGRINDLFSYAGAMFDVGEIDPAEKKIALLTNPEDKAKQQVELDKLFLYNEFTMAENDIKELVKLRTDSLNSEGNVKYYTKRVSEDFVSEESVKEYKKEIKKEQAKIERIKEKMKAKQVTNIDEAIRDAKDAVDIIESKIKDINKTYPAVLEKFTKEYHEQIKNRKTMAQHLEAVSAIVSELKERTPEEVASLRLKKIQAQEEERSVKPVTASAGASVGRYADDTELILGSLDSIRPLHLPDMVEMIGAMEATTKANKRIKSDARVKDNQIQYNPEIFKDTKQVEKIIAHEIGHLIGMEKILTLHNFLKNTFGTFAINTKELRNELFELSKTWRPLPENYTEGFLKYRKSAKELYGDAISVLLNNPGLLEKKAPNFYEAFLKNLALKPDAEKAYFSLQSELVNGMRIGKWRENVVSGFNDAEVRVRQKQEEIKRDQAGQFKKIPFHFRRYLRSIGTPVYDMVKSAEKRGVNIPDEQNPMYLLSNRGYLPDKINNYLEEKLSPVIKLLDDNGLSWDQLGELLMYQRILKGDRQNIANPLGMQSDFMEEVIGENVEIPAERLDEAELNAQSKKGMESLADSTGDSFNVLEQAADDYRAMIKETALSLVDNGRYSIESREMIANNDYYVPFRPVKYADKAVTASIKKQVGTLEAIENPATTGIMKTIAMIRGRENQNAISATINLIKSEHPDGLIKAPTRFVNNHQELDTRVEKINEMKAQGLDLVTYYEDGKRVGYFVDKHIVESLQNNTLGKNHAVLRTLSFMNRLPKTAFITINLAFQIRNLSRDFKRTWRNLASMDRTNLFGYTFKNITSLPSSYRRAIGKTDPLIDQMIKDGAIGEIGQGYIMSGDEKTRYDNLLKKFSGPEAKTVIGKVGRFFEVLTTFGESIPKVAAYKILTEKGIETREKAFIVNTYVGTPNYYEGGKMTNITNPVALFSNVIIQGLAADLDIATNPKTRAGWAWRMAATTVLPKVIMYAMAIGLLGDWLRDWFEGLSEYKRSNYIIIPVGKDKNGKSVGIPIAEDETARIIGSVIWKALYASKNQQAMVDDIRDILSFFSGQLPSITPILTVPYDLANYALLEKAPYDSFRKQDVLNPNSNIAIAGGWDAWKKILKYEFDSLGGSVLFKSTDVSDNASQPERALATPVVGNAIGSVLYVSDFGKSEKYQQLNDTMKKEKAKQSIKESEIITRIADEYRAENNNSIFLRNNYERKAIEEIMGSLPRNPDEKKQAASIKTRVRLAIKKTVPDNFAYQVINANEDQKVELLKLYKDSNSQEDFDAMVKSLIDEKIITFGIKNKLNK